MNSGCRKRLVLVLALVMAAPVLADDTPASTPGANTTATNASKSAPALVVEPRKSETATSASTHRFWDRKNVVLFTGVAATRALDGTSTYNMLNRGREEELLPDDVVNNRGAFAAVEAAGLATSISLSYLLHRTGHHKMERWLSIAHINVAGFGAARNYALQSKHP